MDKPPRSPTPGSDGQACSDRRGMMARLAAMLVGMTAALVPIACTLGVLLDPLRRRHRNNGSLVPVAPLGSLPADGKPYRYPVIAGRQDAWNRYAPQPIGAVFLRRTAPDEPPKAYSAVCPHLGCSVDFKTDRNHYQCPCHNSSWNVDAARIDPERCPSPRDLDELEVQVRDGNIWVQYKRFRSGTSEKIEE